MLPLEKLTLIRVHPLPPGCHDMQTLSETFSLVLEASHSSPRLPGPMCNPCSWQTVVAPLRPAKDGQGQHLLWGWDPAKCLIDASWVGDGLREHGNKTRCSGTRREDHWGVGERSRACWGGEGPMLLSIQMPMSIPICAWTGGGGGVEDTVSLRVMQKVKPGPHS